jgi:hypothetical protein
MKKKWVKPVLTRLMKPSADTKAFMAAHPEVRVVPVPKPAAEFATDARSVPEYIDVGVVNPVTDELTRAHEIIEPELRERLDKP